MTRDERSDDTEANASPRDHGAAPQYEIRVKGTLDPRWAAWFDGLSLTTDDDGTTVISGGLVDQSALHGVLQKVRDIGIPLICVALVPPDAPMAPPAPRTIEGN